MLVLSRRHRASRGFTLTELAIVLGVAGLILGAVWIAGDAVSRSSAIRNGVNDAWMIANNMRALYSGKNVATGLSNSSADTDLTDTLLSSGVFPKGLLNTVTTPYRPYNLWGGRIYIKRGISTGMFRLYFEGINPATSCIQFLASFLGAGSGVNALSLGGSWYPTTTSSTGYSTITTDLSPGTMYQKASSPCTYNASTGGYTAGVEFALFKNE